MSLAISSKSCHLSTSIATALALQLWHSFGIYPPMKVYLNQSFRELFGGRLTTREKPTCRNLDRCGLSAPAMYTPSPKCRPPVQHIAQVNANSNLQLPVCWSAQVALGQRLLEFDGAIHRGHRAGEPNQKTVAYRFYLLSLMFEKRGPQESAVFIEQHQRQPSSRCASSL